MNTVERSGNTAQQRDKKALDRICFLCTRNSARSLMAEAITRSLAGDRFEVLSCGLSPGEPNPLTLRVLGERGLDTSQLRSKGIDTIMGRVGIRYAIMVCEEAEASCPAIYPFATQTLRWPFPDPAAASGSEEERLAKFREVRDSIERRVRSWLAEVA
jgi:arsenate reductase (thioredoxin)